MDTGKISAAGMARYRELKKEIAKLVVEALEPFCQRGTTIDVKTSIEIVATPLVTSETTIDTGSEADEWGVIEALDFSDKCRGILAKIREDPNAGISRTDLVDIAGFNKLGLIVRKLNEVLRGANGNGKSFQMERHWHDTSEQWRWRICVKRLPQKGCA